MKNSPSIDLNNELEQQLATDEELKIVRAKMFINLLSDLFLKYEDELEKQLISVKEEKQYA
ncbi:hypothetical protein [Evansella tamaricis]|uniref:Uncharacterized protein n=1 Tax=Evansella tamaricis TaxID=2069301 RepID=A0ABS6JB39_9BACI|nr:hypothetical protein [Evansella tamaricis]MBU9710896.1 hypothetical protein [Evansella tamaricis]